MVRQPFEIFASFRPRRGALHLGNFASLADVNAANDVNATVIAAMNAAFALGAYKENPRVPVTPLGVTVGICRLFKSAESKADQIANFAYHEGEINPARRATEIPRDWKRAKERWAAARMETLRRSWSALGFAWIAIDLLGQGGTVPPGVSDDKLARQVLTAEEATKFWNEASRMAIMMKVLLDEPFEKALPGLVDSFRDLLPFTKDLVTSTVTRYKNAAYAEIRAQAAAGAVQQFQPGGAGEQAVQTAAKKAVTPLVVGAIVVGGLGLVLGAASFFKKRRK